MHNVYLHTLKITSPLKRGKVTLTGMTGRKYINDALFVPSYGWVPCSRKWQQNPTTDPEALVLVISDPEDVDAPVTSDIWITCTDCRVIATFEI